MADREAPSFRIDWFDGTLVENPQPSTSAFADEDRCESTEQIPPQSKKKPIGFKKLLNISLMEPDKLFSEVTYRPGFWNLFDEQELKEDFIVLIVKILEVTFKMIQLGEASTKMIRSLETRFLPSNFLEMLTCYIRKLPNVKTVEKKNNMQLWDDVETFFLTVVSLCESVMHFPGEKSQDLNNRLEELLKALCESAIGVIKNHSERIHDDLFDKILKLQNAMEDKDVPVPVTVSADSFRNLNIIPTLHNLVTPEIKARLPDLINTSIDDSIYQNNMKMEPILDQGAYPSVEHYLDVQFRLLREDYLGPLREGICDYLKNPSKTKYENIRVYQEVQIIATVIKTKVYQVVDFGVRRTKLMFGSLLLFTSDNFRTILCATDADDGNDFRGLACYVEFHNTVLPKNIYKETYLMIESEVFFEPYHQVLKVLQGSRLDDLPMKKYIVDVKPDTQPPAYLTPQTKYTIQAPDKSEIAFQVLDTDNWPTKHLDLDDSQLEGYKFALTCEFAVIQGPPGTGKTFLGVKIASTILKNISLKGTSMLVICYTNHALDQFLEGILNVTDSVIRLGSQSKSLKLEPYTLKNVKANMKLRHPFFSECKNKSERLREEMAELSKELDKCETGILSYKHIKPYLKIDDQAYSLKKSKEDRILTWLFEHLEENSGDNEVEEISDQDDVEDKAFGVNIDERKLAVCFSENRAKGELEFINFNLNSCEDLNQDTSDWQCMLSVSVKLQRRINCFKVMFDSTDFDVEDEQSEKNVTQKVNDLYVLNVEQRWQLYFYAARQIQRELKTKMAVLEAKYKMTLKELDELTTQIDSEIVSQARVVGVTTTAAARRHQLIKKLKSPIVIVEEAAEMLEAHIIASLTFSLEHLILIGDHKQLRPSAANYKLAKKCNTEVSLFERMIRNGVHSRTLTTQRRMRPNFVQLIVPEIYPKLDSHDTVYRYPDVKGMNGNLYFFTHEVPEDNKSLDDSWSFQNGYEAVLCVKLARCLLQNKYTPGDITIITTYSAQVSLIQREFQKYQDLDHILRQIKVTTVDNFQGEESRIVLLSLVRSNRDGRIGFLSDTNRICVALSRAKEGFYMFGNMKMLSKASSMWMSIKNKLIAQHAIGEVIDTFPETEVMTSLKT